MEDERANTCYKQGGSRVETNEQRHEDRAAKSDEQKLDADNSLSRSI
jgi:hypothetical protein